MVKPSQQLVTKVVGFWMKHPLCRILKAEQQRIYNVHKPKHSLASNSIKAQINDIKKVSSRCLICHH